MFIVLSTWQAIAWVHVINAEQCQMAADLWSKPTDLSYRPAIAIYYYSAQKLILILPSYRG